MIVPDSAWNALLLAVGLAAFAYLVGSLLPAYWVVRRLRGQDIRLLGDGNAGAENAARAAGLKAGILVASMDIGKGLLVVLLAGALTTAAAPAFPPAPAVGPDYRQLVMLLAGLAVVSGHSWPLYLPGTGGRGAASAVGVLFAIIPLAALIAAAPAAVLLCLTRSATWGLAAFFTGAVTCTALLGGLGLYGYAWHWAPYAAATPVLVALVHWRRRPRSRA